MSNKQTILNELFDHQNEYLSGNELSERLNMSRTMIWKYIKALQEEGFNIISKHGSGYQLQNAYTLNSELITRKISQPTVIKTFKTINSTNTYLKNYLATHSIPQPIAFLAEKQTDGYGRFKRSYYSPVHGGLYLSLSLPLNDKPLSPSLLTTSVAVGVVNTLQKYFPKKEFNVKWVNDIYLQDKKIGGILTEATSDLESSTPHDVVIGIGINLTTKHFPDDLKDKAQSIAADLPVDINVIAADLIIQLEQIFTNYHDGHYLPEYKSMLKMLNHPVTLKIGNQIISGIALDINDQGGLIIKTSDNEIHTYYSGEVQKVNLN